MNMRMGCKLLLLLVASTLVTSSRVFAANLDLASSSTVTRSETCADNFGKLIGHETDQLQRSNGTRNFLAYLGVLWAHKIIAREDLQRMLSELDRGVVVNFLSNPHSGSPATHLSAHRLIHAGRLQHFIDRSYLDHAEIRSWLIKKIAESENVQQQRDRVKDDSQLVWREMQFVPVQGGRFDYDSAILKDRSFQIPDLEVQSTLVTNQMWFNLMGNARSAARDKLDHPVSSITIWSALDFANRLSLKNNLTPAYDFTDVQWKGDAAAGTLVPDRTQSLEMAVNRVESVANHPELAQGYRLPTLPELVYLRTNRGRWTKDDLGLLAKQATKYAWVLGNARGSSRAVDDMGVDSLFIDGQEFRDLFGNMQVLSGSFYSHRQRWLVARVGESGEKPELRIGQEYDEPPVNVSTDWMSFRLVRTVR